MSDNTRQNNNDTGFKTREGNSCYVEREKSIYLRRCFMTGEYCSKQRDIKQDKQIVRRTTKELEISAFVIMDFSNTANVVYKWKIIPFIETLKRYLYYDIYRKRIYCYANSKEEEYLWCKEWKEDNQVHREMVKATDNDLNNFKGVNDLSVTGNENEILQHIFFADEGQLNEYREQVTQNESRYLLKKIDIINVVRADSNPTSNYVVCGRICQQLQIADIVIVDVTFNNVNVFYEFGMAVAQEKLILPICYSESFYKLSSLHEMHQQQSLKNEISSKEAEKINHHIDYNPWRRTLYEHFGLKYVHQGSITGYIKYEDAHNLKYQFTDRAYQSFPYTENAIGKSIYNALKKGYRYQDAGKKENYDVSSSTLIVYTVDRILNEFEAGYCILNFYNNITKKMHHHKDAACFIGNRVAILSKNDVLEERQKDAEKYEESLYPVGEIIRIGVNNATNSVSQHEIRIDNDDIDEKYNKYISEIEVESTEQYFDKDYPQKVKDNIKSYNSNRGVLVYPQNPLFVDRLRVIQADLLKKITEKNSKISPEEFFCFYHIMLHNLNSANEVVVDITDNSVQNLFWLGVSHSLGIYAITVEHERSQEEIQKLVQEKNYIQSRHIFDVSGLWTASFSKNAIDKFYKEIADVQRSIEINARLVSKKFDYYDQVRRSFYESTSDAGDEIRDIKKEKKDEEIKQLESYYRRKFWGPLIRFNELSILMEEKTARRDKRITDEYYHARNYTSLDTSISKHDLKALSILSNYLSKRTIIGEYHIVSVPNHRYNLFTPYMKNVERIVNRTNTIIIGSEVYPFSKKNGEYERLISHIRNMVNEDGNNGNNTDVNVLLDRVKEFACDSNETNCNNKCIARKGFAKMDSRAEWYKFHKDYPLAAQSYYYCDRDDLKCLMSSDDEIGQLILWRENGAQSVDSDGDIVGKDNSALFRVGFNGGSGVATYGLAALFVDDYEKEEICTNLGKKSFLYDIQNVIREKILSIFIDTCRGDLHLDQLYPKKEIAMKFKQMDDNAVTFKNKILLHSYYYLNSILYKYFFPFHLKQDVYCISSSVYQYLLFTYDLKKKNSLIDDSELGGDEGTRKEYVLKILQAVRKAIRDVLTNLQGVEIYYKMKIHREEFNGEQLYDTRGLDDIEFMGDHFKYIFGNWGESRQKENLDPTAAVKLYGIPK